MSGNAQVVRQWIGFRNFRIVQEPIPGQIGLTFYFEINNLPIFAKGANWVWYHHSPQLPTAAYVLTMHGCGCVV